MACFLAPVVEAIVITVVKKNIKKKEKTESLLTPVKKNAAAAEEISESTPFSTKLGWLTKMLWGGAFLLALEHIWHGEVVPWPPFLTAMNNPADVGPMLHEIATVGVTMAVFVTAVWGIMVLVYNRLERREKKTAILPKTEG